MKKFSLSKIATAIIATGIPLGLLAVTMPVGTILPAPVIINSTTIGGTSSAGQTGNIASAIVGTSNGPTNNIFINASGVLAQQPDDATLGSNIVEENGATELLLHNTTMTGTGWSNAASGVTAASAVADPFGGTNSFTVTNNGVIYGDAIGSITIANDSSIYTASCYINDTLSTTTDAQFTLVFTTGGTLKNTDLIQINTQTNTVKLLGSTTLGHGFVPVPQAPGWYKAWATGANNNTGNTALQFKIFPTAAGTTGYITVAGCTIFKQAYPHSYVANTGTGTIAAPNGINIGAGLNQNGAALLTNIAPVIASGFGSSPSVAVSNGTAAFTVNVGTGGIASAGVITMPAALTGWACKVSPNGAPQAAAVTYSAPTSATSITLTNYTLTTGVALAWTASTVLSVQCTGY